MIKFFQTREEAIEYALALVKRNAAAELRAELLKQIELAIASGLIGDN